MARTVPWPRIVAEGLAIVVSILLAFGIQAWWERRGEDEVAADYMERLDVDLRRDTSALAYLLEGMSRKADALLGLQAALRDPGAEVQLAPLLLQAEQYGWGQFTFSGTTFEDLRSTGNLRLIRDPRVRAALVDYYETWALEQGRISSRRSNLPALVFKLLPIDFADADVSQRARVDENLELDLRQLGDGSLPLLTPIIDSEEFRLELQHELNYTDFVHAALSRLHQDARQLLQLLEGQ